MEMGSDVTSASTRARSNPADEAEKSWSDLVRNKSRSDSDAGAIAMTEMMPPLIMILLLMV